MYAKRHGGFTWASRCEAAKVNDRQLAFRVGNQTGEVLVEQ